MTQSEKFREKLRVTNTVTVPGQPSMVVAHEIVSHWLTGTNQCLRDQMDVHNRAALELLMAYALAGVPFSVDPFGQVRAECLPTEKG